MMVHNSEAFKTIVDMIERGEEVGDSELLPFLTLESKEDRCEVNTKLGRAYFKRYQSRDDQQSLRWAKSCVDRAWLLSRYSLTVLTLLNEIEEALKDVAAIKESFKQAGLELAAKGDVGGALEMLDRWSWANVRYTGIDTYSYDPEVIACVERISAIYRFDATFGQPKRKENEKIRLAYLMHGLPDAGSVLVKIDQVFAAVHDKSRFEIAYFSVDNESTVAASPDAQAAIKDIQSCNCEVFVAPDSENLRVQLLSLGARINEYRPDILITTAGLASFKNYFVACLKPAPLIIALHHGPSPQFSWHTFDHSISFLQTNLVDCPADCSHVPLEFELPKQEEIQTASRTALGIPENAILIASGGRWPKFQDREFWQTMIEVLRRNTNVYWMVIGVLEGQVSFLPGLLAGEERERICFLGWRSDYLELLKTSDLLIDSYPVGGGVLLLEAMSLGLPVLSFQHDYLSTFSNNDCSGGKEIVGIPELLIRRGDFEQLKNLVNQMVSNEQYRHEVGQRCYERVFETRGNVARMVRRCEDVYMKVLDEHRSRAEDSTAANSDRQGLFFIDDFEHRKQVLIEQADILNRQERVIDRREAMVARYEAMVARHEAIVARREAMVDRREAMHKSIVLYRLERSVRWRLNRLIGK